MLEKNIDMTVVGKSYLSFMLSMKLLDSGKSVLLLDDKRMKFGDLYTNGLTALDKSYLETWGADSQVEPLINLERYLKVMPVNYIVGSKRIRLGSTPVRNLREILRNFPSLASNPKAARVKEIISNPELGEDFNVEFDNYCQTVSKSAFLSSSAKSLGLNLFTDFCSKDITIIYELFKESLSSPNHGRDFDPWDLKTFLFSAKGLFHKKLTLHMRDVEVFHLMICLLSPHFDLRNEDLLNEIVPSFEDKGGVFRNTEIREWSFYKNRPWSMELASYEGIIHPSKIALLGSFPKNIPVRLSPDLKSYCSVKVSWKFELETEHIKAGEKILFCSKVNIGTNRPLWFGLVNKDGIDFDVFVLRQDGLKISFIQEEIRNSLKVDLKTLFPNIDEAVIEEKVEFGDDHLIMDNARGSNFSTVNINVLDCSDPINHKKLKNVEYFGPYKECSLGMFSSMVAMKCYDGLS